MLVSLPSLTVSRNVCCIALWLTIQSFSSVLFADELESVSLKLKWHHQFQFAGYYAAIEKDFYEQAGFEVTLVEHQGNSDLYAPVASGEIEFGTADSSIVVNRQNGLPLVILSTVFQHSPAVLISLKDKGLLSPLELIGKRVMFQQSADDAAIQAMLISLGIRPTDYELMPHNFDDLALVNSGYPLDAMSAYLSNEPFLYQQAGYDIQIIDPANYGIDFYGDLLYTSEQYISEHPNRAIAFRDASLKGWAYALDNPDEVISWLFDKYPANKDIEALKYEADIIRKMIAADFVPLGSLYPARFQRIAAIYKQLGLGPSNGTLDGLLLNDYLELEAGHSARLLRVIGIIAAILLLLIGILVLIMKSLRNTIKNRTSELNSLNEVLTHQIQLTDEYVISATISADGRFTEVSTAFCNISGYSNEELLQLDPRKLTPENVQVERNLRLSRVLSGQAEQGDIRQIHKDGSDYWLHLFADPLINGKGQITGMRITATDITEKKIIERLSETDDLTGIANRKKLDQVLGFEWARYLRYKHEVAVILLDLDLFKQINDNYGHSEGDSVLKLVSNLLAQNVRHSDLAGRWGGEEFLVILPQTTLDDAVMVAEKLRLALSGITGLPHINITASFGVASSSQASDLDNLFRLVDEALYNAKRNGRNCIEAAQ